MQRSDLHKRGNVGNVVKSADGNSFADTLGSMTTKKPAKKAAAKRPNPWPLGFDPMGDFGDDAVVDFWKSPQGEALVLPRSAGRLDGERFAMLRDLQRHGHELRSLESHVDSLAEACHAEGISWSLIGFAIGLTGEAARQRYRQEIP